MPRPSIQPRLQPILKVGATASATILLLCGLVGCDNKAETARLQQLQQELVELEGQINAARTSLEQAQVRHQETQAEAAIIGDIQAGFRPKLLWNHAGPLLSGSIRNDSSASISSITIHLTLNEGTRVTKQELLPVQFVPILLPDSERTFSVEASPFIWGFQEPLVSGFHRHPITEVVLANGHTLRDDFSATRRRELELERQRKALLELQLQHGSVYQELAHGRTQ